MEPGNLIPLALLANFQVTVQAPDPVIIVWIMILLVLLLCSALISGSEVAFFTLSPSDVKSLKSKNTPSSKKIIRLLVKPEYLLGTILVVNNFVNVSIVIISAYVTNSILDFGDAKILGFLIQVVFITFLLLLFGEILPKIYANQYAVKFSCFMAASISFLQRVFMPISYLLVSSTKLVNKRLNLKKSNISMDELSDALSLPETRITEDKQILKGIVKFGNIDAKEIMKSRLDVFAISMSTPFQELPDDILKSGYSRIPVYSDSFDQIKGILYIKDLLPHMHKGSKFKWQSLIRPPYFVPEAKKINDLLEEFQRRKIHMAIVIDEYGGTSGIVTLEDILEEIVGEIKDEFDEDEDFFTRMDDSTWVFEGKTLLNDFYKVLEKPEDIFDDIKGEADTLAGLILEVKGDIPEKNEIFHLGGFEFKIESVDKRRIKEIKITTARKK